MKNTIKFLIPIFAILLILQGCNGNFGYSGKKVKLDLYIMSQCPYGTQVIDAIAPVAKKMGSALDLHINYIANKASDGSFQSLHGQAEVDENIRQLCAIKHAPKKYLDYITCQNKDIRNASKNAEKCTKESNIDYSKIKTCFEEEEGKELLNSSLEKAKEVNATGSPTMYINDEPYKGGRSTSSFQRSICQAIDNGHNECKNITACSSDNECGAETDKIGKCINPDTKEAKCEYFDPEVIHFTILNDKRCKNELCNIDPAVEQLKLLFKGLEIKKLDYNETDGKKMYDDLQIGALPALLFENNVEKGEGYANIQKFLVKAGEYQLLQIGASFDPTKEICDNKIDDTGNGKTDCADEDCQENIVCRENILKKLDLFVMSQCPYGTKALDSMKEILENFKGNINFDIHFIASENPDGTFNSLHGQPEVDENIRELCVKKYYPNDYKYMDYIWCRNKDIKNSDWKSCAKEAKLNVNTIKSCLEGDEGKNLHSKDIKLANSLNITASPTWLTNNKNIFSGIDAETIKQNYCSSNPGLKGCESTLSMLDNPNANNQECQ